MRDRGGFFPGQAAYRPAEDRMNGNKTVRIAEAAIPGRRTKEADMKKAYCAVYLVLLLATVLVFSARAA